MIGQKPMFHRNIKHRKRVFYCFLTHIPLYHKAVDIPLYHKAVDIPLYHKADEDVSKPGV